MLFITCHLTVPRHIRRQPSAATPTHAHSAPDVGEGTVAPPALDGLRAGSSMWHSCRKQPPTQDPPRAGMAPASADRPSGRLPRREASAQQRWIGCGPASFQEHGAQPARPHPGECGGRRQACMHVRPRSFPFRRGAVHGQGGACAHARLAHAGPWESACTHTWVGSIWQGGAWWHHGCRSGAHAQTRRESAACSARACRTPRRRPWTGGGPAAGCGWGCAQQCTHTPTHTHTQQAHSSSNTP
jgi:hypothetical protein